MQQSQGSYRVIRGQINNLNKELTEKRYENVDSLLSELISLLGDYKDDKSTLSKLFSTFEFGDLFSFMFNSIKHNSDITNSIIFMAISCQSDAFSPSQHENPQKMEFLLSMLDNYLPNEEILKALLSIICRITTPFIHSYITYFQDNEPILKLLKFSSIFPITHIFYNVLCSAMNDNFDIQKRQSKLILAECVRSLENHESVEEDAYALKILALYISKDIFPLDFDTDVILFDRFTYLNGPEMIIESFLEFALSYSEIEPEILNDFIPFFFHSNSQISLKAINIYQKQESIDINQFPSLFDAVIQVFEKEPVGNQREIFPLALEFIKRKQINADLITIILERMTFSDACLNIIADISHEFCENKAERIGDLSSFDFFEILDEFLDDLNNLLINEKDSVKENTLKEQKLKYIIDSIYHQQNK